MGGMPEVLAKKTFGNLNFKITTIIRFWCLNFFRIQFLCKSLFLSSWLREEREGS
jgi:hypothetical protein